MMITLYRSFILLLFILSLTSSLEAQQLKPTADKALMKVKVQGMKNGKAKSGQKVTLTGIESGKEYVRTTGSDGTFKILLPKGEVYQASYEILGQRHRSKKIQIPDKKGKFSASITLMYQKPDRITLRDVHFNTGESKLRSSSYEALDRLVKALEKKESMRVLVAGHTDNKGDKASNRKLSRARAKAVKDYLVENGIDPSRVEAKGYGESQPVAPNDTPEGRQKNRRTEVRILER